VTSIDPCALLASQVVSTLRPDINQKVADLTGKFPALNSSELRLRLWVTESIVVLLAGENSTADPARLDRFYDAFWSDVSWQLKLDLPNEEVRQGLDAGLDRLAKDLESDFQRFEPEKASMALTRRIADFLQVPETVSLNYGYKLATSTKLLNQLPD